MRNFKGKNNPFYGRKHTEETKKKLRELHKGSHLREETKKKLSLIRIGYKHTSETKRKMSEAQRGEKHAMYGKHHSEEAKKKISFAHKGEKNYMYGKHHSEEAKKKISLANKGEKNYMYGKHHSEEAKKKIREARKKRIFPIYSTKPEKQFMALIKKYNLPYKFVGDRKFWIENINPDFIDYNGEKIAVEIFGDYWHNPERNKNVKQSETEEGRKKILAEYGWKCIVIWESELKNLSEKEILNKTKE